jgi:chromosome segregation ATPase
MNSTNIIGGIIAILILCSPFLLIYWIVKKIKQRRGQKALNDYQELADKKAQLQVEIDEKSKELSLIKDELKIYESEDALLSVGLYKPMFNFDTSEEYKDKISELREKQKELFKSGRACICSTSWTVGNGKDAKKKGAAMTKDNIDLALRSFNGECDALLTKVNGRNVDRIKKSMEMSYERINKLNVRNVVKIQPAYLNLKIQELMATYEYALKKEEERAEQLRIKEEMREEARAQRELEKAKADAEKAQREAEQELENARKLLEKDRANTELQARIAELEQKYQEALERSERATSQAQLTKSGHVYVISNIGSFGENVFKIGMTRRLEPLDRIRELGDASVPFSFDVHALIYSENAPALENELHKVFADHQVNRVNPRKEFFKVPLDMIANEVKKRNAKIEFTMMAEASEYYQSLAMEKEHKYTDIIESDDEDLSEEE